MNPLLRSFALSVYSGLIRGSATDFRFPRKPNPPKFRPLHQATLALSPESGGEGTNAKTPFSPVVGGEGTNAKTPFSPVVGGRGDQCKNALLPRRRGRRWPTGRMRGRERGPTPIMAFHFARPTAERVTFKLPEGGRRSASLAFFSIAVQESNFFQQR